MNHNHLLFWIFWYLLELSGDPALLDRMQEGLKARSDVPEWVSLALAERLSAYREAQQQ